MTEIKNIKNISEFEDKSLLIVDDDNPFRERLARAMEKKGFLVSQATGVKVGIESVNLKNRSFFSTVLGLAFRKLDVFGYYKFVTAVKNINLLPNRDNVISEKKAKFFSNFAFKGVIGLVTLIYLALFSLSFWQIID